MKVINKLFLIVISFVIITSCEDIMDIHKVYIEQGEIIYAQKPDSISFIAGKNRVLFKGWMYNAVNIKTLNILWDNGVDSISIPVSFNTGMDSIEVIIPDLPEKSYTFNVYSTDNFGHRSLNLTNFGSSYGDIYTSSIIDRRIKSIGLTDKAGVIDWFSAPEGLIYNEVRYELTNGEKLVVRVSDSIFTTSLSPLPASSTVLEYRSLYIPEEESVDTFYTEWVDYLNPFPATFLYDRTNWTIAGFSDDKPSDGGGVGTLIDGDLSTYWHSQWGPDVPLPHWAIIDMESPKQIASMDIYRRAGSGDTKTVQLFISNSSDPNSDDWLAIGEGVFVSGDKITIESISDFAGRYLKILLPDSNRPPFTAVAEIYVYGK